MHAGQDPAANSHHGHDSAVERPSNDISPEIYVPAFPINDDGLARVEFQLCRSGGSTLVVGFTSLTLLVERLGEYQPWIKVTVGRLLAMVAAYEISGLVIDPAEDVMSPVWTEKSLESLAGVNNV